MKITPDLIPHEDFHTGAWLQSAERPAWYYFRKKINPNIITNPDFFGSVDEPLRELVQFLHAKKIKTTPSCSGHQFNKERFERIYDQLEEDSYLIRNAGLKMKDVETGEFFFYRNKKYALPWTKAGFLVRIKDYQGKGVLGLRPGNRKKIKHQLVNLTISNVRIVEKDAVLLFLTGENGPGDIQTTWKGITKQVKQVFNSLNLVCAELVNAENYA